LEALVVLSVSSDLELKRLHVGPNCMLAPTAIKNSAQSAKHILLFLSITALHELVTQLVSSLLITLLRCFALA
jgi:hypothetical protein